MNQLILIVFVIVGALVFMNGEKSLSKVLSKSKSLVKGNTGIVLLGLCGLFLFICMNNRSSVEGVLNNNSGIMDYNSLARDITTAVESANRNEPDMMEEEKKGEKKKEKKKGKKEETKTKKKVVCPIGGKRDNLCDGFRGKKKEIWCKQYSKRCKWDAEASQCCGK